MTTTALINLLKKYEFGAITGRPRKVYLEIEDEIIDTDEISVGGTGDGLFSELFLSIESQKRTYTASVPPAGPRYEELSPEEAAAEISPGSVKRGVFWYSTLFELMQMGFVVCRKLNKGDDE